MDLRRVKTEPFEIERNVRGLVLHDGTLINVRPICKPKLISLSNGWTGQIKFKTEDEIVSAFLPIIRQNCLELGADCYESGDRITTWSSDPGFGSRTDHCTVQFYKLYLEYLNDLDINGITRAYHRWNS